MHDPAFELPTTSDLNADLRFIKDTIPDKGAVPIDDAIKALQCLVRISAMGWDTATVSDANVDVTRQAVRSIRPDISETERGALPDDFVVTAREAAASVLIPHDHDDGFRAVRSDITHRFIAKLKDIYYQRRIQSSGCPLFRDAGSSRKGRAA